MKTVPVNEIFDVKYGVNLELNKLTQTPSGINFVSRTAKNNGVSAKVAPLPSVVPLPAGTISVSAGGSIMESFLQSSPYYTGRDVLCLTPTRLFTLQELLYYCCCLRANKFRYSYGRQANRTLPTLLIPHPDEIPVWVSEPYVPVINQEVEEAFLPAVPTDDPVVLDPSSWGWFNLTDWFSIQRGKNVTKQQMTPGTTAHVGASAFNNGVTARIDQTPNFPGNILTIASNGSIGESFYQKDPCCVSGDVTVLTPKFEMNVYTALFLITVIKQEKPKYSYGRKWVLERMRETKIKLPATPEGQPDWEYMERYIKSLPFSSQI